MAVLVFLFLWFYLIYLSDDKELEDPGIEIAFADMPDPELPLPFKAEQGAEGSSAAEGEPQPAPLTPTTQPTKSETARPLVPQEATKAPIAQQHESPVQQETQEQEDKAAKAAAEAKARADAAAKAKADSIARVQAEKAAKAQKMGSLFGKGTGGAGGTGGQSNTGSTGAGKNPASGKGKGKSGNGSWSLAGRDIVGTLPQPEKGRYEAGTVVIEIRVNPEGKVVSARETKGGNISDRATIDAMLQKAREARFTPSEQKQDQIGLITYIIPT